MAANVLDSDRAVEMSVEVVKAFIRLRKAAVSGESIRRKLSDLERAIKTRLDQHDEEIEELFEMVESLIEGPPLAAPRKPIGFQP